MKKEIIAPGNIIAGANRELIVKELKEKTASCIVDGAVVEFSYDDLDGILITEDWLAKNGYSHRVLTGKDNYDDWIQQTEGENFHTITVSKVVGSLWELKIDDHNFANILTANIRYIHSLQNLIENVIYV